MQIESDQVLFNSQFIQAPENSTWDQGFVSEPQLQATINGLAAQSLPHMAPGYNHDYLLDATSQVQPFPPPTEPFTTLNTGLTPTNSNLWGHSNTFPLQWQGNVNNPTNTFSDITTPNVTTTPMPVLILGW